MGIAALLSLFVLVSWTSERSPAQELGTITVTGDAEVRVVPDEVIVTLGVETWDEALEVAKADNDRRVKEILALARAHGIEDKHVQTDHMSIEPRYHDGYENRGFIAFFVRKTVVITLRDITQFEDLLTSVLTGGATHVHGIQFRTTELRTHKDQARTLAVIAAREKAVAIAGALGRKVGGPQMIREDHSGWWSPYGSWWGSRWGGVAQNVIQNIEGSSPAGDGNLAPGQIAVNARVTVSFEVE
jgi:uncharacterized protein YggE